MKRFDWNTVSITMNSMKTMLLVGCLVAMPGIVAAEMPSWWPGSGSDEAPAGTAPEQRAPTPTDSADPMVDAPLFDISWPKVEMPKFNWKPAWGNQQPGAPAAKKDNPISGALDKVSTASKDAANGVRNAWGSAIAKLTPGAGESNNPQMAKKEEPGFWSRMFGPEPKPQGSETIAEFLAQDRPGTTRR